MPSISTSHLDALWREAKALKSYHDLLKFIETLPDSKGRASLKKSVEELLLCEGTETKFLDTDEPTTVKQNNPQSNDEIRHPNIWDDIIEPNGQISESPYATALKLQQEKNKVKKKAY